MVVSIAPLLPVHEVQPELINAFGPGRASGAPMIPRAGPKALPVSLSASAETTLNPDGIDSRALAVLMTG